METEQQELIQELCNLLKDFSLIKMKEKEITSKQEFLDKYLLPALDNVIDSTNVQNHKLDKVTGLAFELTEQIKSQDLAIKNSFEIYQEAMKQRELRAKKFVEGKSSDELKEFLANQFVSYNSWKSADHDDLVKLVLNCYDEED